MRLDEEVFEFDREDDEIESEYDTENVDAELSEQAQRQLLKEQQLIDELEADAAENPIEDDRPDEDSERKKLKRELQAEALARLEDAARTVSDFEKVVAWWDKLDANRERRERYHEVGRDEVPLEWGASPEQIIIPDPLQHVYWKQILKGEFLDAELIGMQVYEDLDEYIVACGYDVRCFGYDPYNAKEFVERWAAENGPFGIEKVIQGAKTESVPLGELKKLAEDRMLLFDEELMTYAMGNCIAMEDTNGNRKLMKKRYEQKIDAVSAMMDAYIAYKRNPEAFE